MHKKQIEAALSFSLLAALTVTCATGCGKEAAALLNPDEPVTLTVWHYYNGSQQAAIEALLEEFNATVGREQGIYVEEYSQGSVGALQEALEDALEEKVGAPELPNLFSAYADMADGVRAAGRLVDLNVYFSEEELAEFVDSYVQEGYFANDGALYLLPVAKSTEVFLLNGTDWEVFAQATDSRLEELATTEGVTAVAQRYYEWTDAQTPEIPDDGKAFYGIDSMSNYLIVGMRQMGTEIFGVDEAQQVTLNLDKDKLRRLWENYYVPFVKGYFGAYGKFRSDDVKTGELLAYTGSTSSVYYFPDQVETETGSYAIDYIVQKMPVMAGGENYQVQQGAGMAITKSDAQHEYAASVFLKWFTQKEQNLRFISASSYLPVRKEANSIETLNETLEKYAIEMNRKSYDCLKILMEQTEDEKFYTAKIFPNAYDARSVLATHLWDRAIADQKAVSAAVTEGISRADAAAPYVTDAAFELWYEEFCTALADSVR